MSDLVLTGDNSFLSRLTKTPQSGDTSPQEAVEHFIRESLSENTRKAYRSDLSHFQGWGGKLPATPESVSLYLASFAETLKPASLSRRIATLSKVHEASGWPNPCRTEAVRATLRGIKRLQLTAQRQAKPLLREELFLLLDALQGDARSIRDRSLLLLGWAGGFRCSELTGLDLSDIEEVREGLIVHLRRSKTDQLGQGRKVGIPIGRTRHCPVSAFVAWRCKLSVEGGPIYRPVNRHGHICREQLRSDAVSIVIRDRLDQAGIEPEGYSGHSLRAGLATSAIQAGVSTYKIRAQTGHASDAMLSRYVRDGEMFDGNAAAALL